MASVGYLTELSTGALNISPLAFCNNAIVVGAVDLEMSEGIPVYSEYVELNPTAYSSSGIYYPHVVAPGNIDCIPNMTGQRMVGNSFSTPLVTGMIAQLMEFDPTLIGNPELVKAVVLAGANGLKSDSTTVSNGIDMDRKYGAGVVNAASIINFLVSPTRTDSWYFEESEADYHSYSITFASNPSPVRIALVWNSESQFSGDHVTTTPESSDYSYAKLKVTSSQGVEYVSYDLTGTFQLLTIDPPDTDGGRYIITIERNSSYAYEMGYAIAVNGNVSLATH